MTFEEFARQCHSEKVAGTLYTAQLYAEKGCYDAAGNRPKKETVAAYKETEEYRERRDAKLQALGYEALRAIDPVQDEDFRREIEPRYRAYLQEEERKARKQKVRALVEKTNVHAVLKAHFPEIEEHALAKVRSFFEKSKGVGLRKLRSGKGSGRFDPEQLSERNFDEFRQMFRTNSYFTEKKLAVIFGSKNPGAYLVGELISYVPEIQEEAKGDRSLLEEAGWRIESGSDIAAYRKKLLDFINSSFTEADVHAALLKNPKYRRLVSKIDAMEASAMILQNGMIERIPASPVELYPAARMLSRHFVLHIGPTNSGKTYSAMQALREAGSGIYLAPLRLLAYEQYDTMNRDGYPCSMITGEERIDFPGADFQSSTIEMASLSKFYECAVVDEAQMIADPERGGSWTAAVLGLCSGEIHVCAAPEAESLLIRLIESCGDSYEIERHERRTELLFDRRKFSFPKDLENGDALIVFSRANVHAVAMEVRRTRSECSVIYGALPYDVRHEEARKFSSGETRIVVATDAIGMGLNLPIRRIVFLEGSKFDGQVRRPLRPSEVKQIAGRAGRYGIYDTGYVTAEHENRGIITDGLYRENDPIEQAVLSFPESLLGIDAPLSDILERWTEWEIDAGFQKEDLKQVLMLVRSIEKPDVRKELLYDLATIPFDADESELLFIWRDMADCELMGEKYDTIAEMEAAADFSGRVNIETLEAKYRVCDLLYFYNEKFGMEEKNPQILEVKRGISHEIIKLLDAHKLQERRCKRCGRKLKWNHPYAVCESCYHDGGGYRRRRIS